MYAKSGRKPAASFRVHPSKLRSPSFHALRNDGRLAIDSRNAVLWRKCSSTSVAETRAIWLLSVMACLSVCCFNTRPTEYEKNAMGTPINNRNSRYRRHRPFYTHFSILADAVIRVLSLMLGIFAAYRPIAAPRDRASSVPLLT